MKDTVAPPLFYFPTSIVLVDDDRQFLEHFSLLIDRRLNTYLHTSPSEALSRINRQSDIARDRLPFKELSASKDIDPRACLNIRSISNHYQDIERFARISVVIVDYAMPEMDGLEFCSRIRQAHTESHVKTPIKTILLTGRADEKIAVEAFNKDLIDRFFLKSSDDVEKQINQAINELQQDWFKQVSSPISRALLGDVYSFLDEPGFNDYFADLLEQGQWVEYYLWENPQGILLVDEKGGRGFLLIASKEDLRAQFETAQEGEASQDLLKTLETRDYIAQFPTQDGFFRSACEDPEQWLFPATEVGGKDQWRVALASPSPFAEPSLHSPNCFRQFIDARP